VGGLSTLVCKPSVVLQAFLSVISGGPSQGEYADHAQAQRYAEKCPEPYSRVASTSWGSFCSSALNIG
jgi:hypothetical protein